MTLDLTNELELVREYSQTYRNSLGFCIDNGFINNSFSKFKEFVAQTVSVPISLDDLDGLFDKGTNLKLRYIHDVIHYKHNLSFSYVDEVRVARITANEFKDRMLPNHCTTDVARAAVILAADTIAQAYYYKLTKKFIKNQEVFMLEVIRELDLLGCMNKIINIDLIEKIEVIVYNLVFNVREF